MAFDIDKMKADGVSPRLIELASMNQETFLLLIARRLEHDKLFQQFMGENAGSIESMYPYAVAAGLMTEEDRKWLIDEGNPYKPQGGEVWFTGTVDTSKGCIDQRREVITTATEKANTPKLNSNPSDYSVQVNGVDLPYFTNSSWDEVIALIWADTESVENATCLFSYASAGGEFESSAEVPCDITGEVEVTVTHK